MSDRAKLPGDPSYPPGVSGTEPQITGAFDPSVEGEQPLGSDAHDRCEACGLLGGDHRIDCATPPLALAAIRVAAGEVWETYAEDRAAQFIEVAAEVQKLEDDARTGSPRNVLEPANAIELNAWIARDREGTFSDAFALGAAFVAGAAATVRVGADDSGNSESYKGIGIALNCSMFGDDFGNVIVMLAKEHGIEPLPDNATSGEWEGRCAVVLVVDNVGAYDATRLGNAALAAINTRDIPVSPRSAKND